MAGVVRDDPLLFGDPEGCGLDSFGAEEGVAEDEEDAEDPDEGADFAVAAGAEFVPILPERPSFAS